MKLPQVKKNIWGFISQAASGILHTMDNPYTIILISVAGYSFSTQPNPILQRS